MDLKPDYITFFDGLTGVFKDDANISDLVIRGDITQPITSEVKISQKIKVNQGDIWSIPSNSFPLSGVVADIDTNVYTNDQIIFLYVGSDVYTNDILMVNNSLIPNLSVDNNQSYNVSVNGTKTVTGVDYLLGIDTIARQLMRLEPCTRNMNRDGCIIASDPDPVTIKVRLDDPIISVSNVYFAEDRFNVLKLYNRENLSQTTSYYMDDNGTITTTINNTFLHRPKSIIVEPTEWNSLTYASSVLKSQEYNNEIEFTIPINNDIGINHDQFLLGKKIVIYMDGYPPLNSIISGYHISTYDYINITVGLSRSRMTDYLNSEV